jgi:hypothetical protein
MKLLIFAAMMALSGCTTLSEVQANFMLANSPERVANCDYIGAFKTHFDSDGVPETLASTAERTQSTLDMRIVRDHGANTILRVEPAPGPLVQVNAYRCLGWFGLSGQLEPLARR